MNQRRTHLVARRGTVRYLLLGVSLTLGMAAALSLYHQKSREGTRQDLQSEARSLSAHGEQHTADAGFDLHLQQPAALTETVSDMIVETGAADTSAFEVHMWPGEGRPVMEAASAVLEIRNAPSTNAPIVDQVLVEVGDPLEFDETRYRTRSSGQIIAIGEGYIRGRDLGRERSLTREAYYSGVYPEIEAPVDDGEAVEFLQYRAEGTCFVRIRESTIDADPCPAFETSTFRIASEPEVEWWIRVRLGGEEGWLPVDQQQVRVAARTW